METTKEYLRSHHGVVRAPLAYVIRKIITVETYGDYPTYEALDNEIITRMLHLPSEKNKLHNKQSAWSVTEHTTEYRIDNRTAYDILDKICKDTELYPYVKQNKSKRDSRGAFYAIHSMCLGANHVNTAASEAEMALKMLMYDGEK